MIQNPILPGFHADPCICRKGDDFYIAVSSFEWFPGIPIYHSKDMKNWELYSHALTNAEDPDLKKLPSAKGIWAPCLTYCEADDLFYVVYGVMNSMHARYFDVDNYLITAKDLIAQLKDKELGEYLLLPINMFRSGETVFLDDLTAEDVEKALQVKIRIVKSDGQDFVHAILEPSSEPEPEPMEEGLPGEEYGYEGYELDEIWEDEDDETEQKR